MSNRRPVLSLALAVTLLGPAASLAEETLPAGEIALEKATLDAVRTVGVALFYWARDNGPKSELAESDDPTADLSAIPPISTDELATMLVPKYLPKLELVDGWGHPLEVRFDRTMAGPRVMSVRSSGSDGRFDGDRYPIAAFDPADASSDVVWVDGYFVRWPSKKAPSGS